MSFSGGLSQQTSYSFMPDFRGLSSTSEHVSMRLPRIRPQAWQPISLLARGLFLGPHSHPIIKSRRSAGLYTPRPPRFNTWVYIMVEGSLRDQFLTLHFLT
jgi:hypothetical protein